jgi:hypothetical protein
LDSELPKQVAPRRGQDDKGVVVVIVAAAMGALLVMTALVLDLSGARRDRDADQVAADAIALAAAASLSEGSTTAKSACLAAWTYLTVNLPSSETAPLLTGDPCAPFHAVCVPAGPSRAVLRTVGQYVITLTHPVPDGDALLEGRTDAALDGGPCQRFGVRIQQSRANLVASGSVALDVDAVGRFVPGVGEVSAPLVVLSEHECEVLKVRGTSGLIVETADGAPGYIAIDSDGSACNNPLKVVLDVDGNGSITADEVAMWALADGDPTSAYSSGLISPSPTASSARVGTSGMDWRYNCSSLNACPGPGPAHIDDMTAAWGGPVGTAPAGFSTWSDCSPNVDVVVPAGNWFINCGTQGLSTSKRVTFQGGNVVSDGPISAGGGLRVNCDAGAAATCPTDPTAPSTLYLRSGDLLDNAPVELRETMVYLGSGTARLAGNNQVTWTAPDDPTQPFDDLLLWTMSPDDIRLTGRANLDLEGIIYAPNASMELAGTVGGSALKAQIFAASVELVGTATLTLRPETDRMLQVGRGKSLLIR